MYKPFTIAWFIRILKFVHVYCNFMRMPFLPIQSVGHIRVIWLILTIFIINMVIPFVLSFPTWSKFGYEYDVVGCLCIVIRAFFWCGHVLPSARIPSISNWGRFFKSVRSGTTMLSYFINDPFYGIGKLDLNSCPWQKIKIFFCNKFENIRVI